MADPDTQRTIVVTLVHGTWARGIIPQDSLYQNRWFEPKGEFRPQLVAALFERRFDKVITSSLLWTGANSIKHRDDAARALAAMLDDQLVRYPSAVRLVVAHSHGGNVALRSFSHLKQSSDQLSVVTLATPFVEIVSSGMKRQVVMVASTLMLLLAASTLAAQYLLYPDYPLAGLTVSVVLFVIFNLMMLRAVNRYRVSEPNQPEVAANVSSRHIDLVESSSQAAFRVAAPPTLVLRGADDEAALALAAGSIAARLGSLGVAFAFGLWEIGRRAVAGIAVIGPPFFLTVDKIIENSSVASDGLNSVFLFIGGSWLAIICTPSVFVIAWRLGLMAFGRELFSSPGRLEVTANSAPDTKHNTRVLTLDDSGSARSTLRHALYLHPHCIGSIVDFVSGEQ